VLWGVGSPDAAGVETGQYQQFLILVAEHRRESKAILSAVSHSIWPAAQSFRPTRLRDQPLRTRG
jgi:hypothetical protein